jgi:uncharacterized protein (DUF302 family)
MNPSRYGISRTFANMSLEQGVDAITASLAEVGFGILTRIDIHNTLKEKLDLSFRPYTILGACQPQLAIQALEEEPQIGLLMPCNIVVQQIDDGCEISFIDPDALASLVDGETTKGVMQEAKHRLEQALGAIQ